MKRREFITILGGAAAWPLSAHAQQPGIPVVGYLDATAAAATSYQVLAFRQGLSEGGFFEGRNIAIEYRWAEGQLDRLPSLVDDLVRREVAAIVTTNTTTPAAKAATSTIPIVFVSGADPVQAGLVANLNRPGGNVTGVSFTAAPLNPKRFEILDELVPKPVVIAALMDSKLRDVETRSRDVEAAARTLRRPVMIMKASSESELDAAFTSMVQAGAGALFVAGSAIFTGKRRQIVALAARHALPAIYPFREYVDAGGLMSYGSSITDAYRRGSAYVVRILKGAKPSDLPVELPTKYELVINLATAKAFKVDIPPKLLALADEIIE
jgi:putative ABC transport system substrate-binding protein